MGSAHRVAFSEKLKTMWDDIMYSEVMKGSIDSGTDHRVFLYCIGKIIPSEDTMVHDNLCALSSEEYIEERLEYQLSSFKRIIPAISFRIKLIQFCVIVASSTGALLAAYNLQLWMPVLLSIVTVLESIFEYNKMPLLLRSTNVAYSKLKKVLFWWTGLTLIQQRMPQNKMQLVNLIESILYDRLIILHEG